ncbi:MAG: SDR family oxidoreductase [Gammaproteobacteria bacterium]|nr:SDR family oxidoreductase [Gammaproteobacteria bacterium]
MKVLMTGNLGYIGPVLVEHLRRSDPSVELVGVDQAWFAHCLTTPQGLPERLLDTQQFADVRDLTARDLQGFDAVVHLAAVSNDPMGKRFENVTEAINYGASAQLAQAAAAAGVGHFVFASSCSIYGFAADGRPRREGDEVAPLTAYARSKVATEAALAELDAPDMVISCLRFATACGMSPRLRLDLVLNDFVAGALAGGEISVLSDGTPWRPLIHVKDMARAIEWAISRQSENGGRMLTVNVGSEDWNFQVAGLARAVAEAIPGTRVSINESAAPDKRSYRVDFSKYRELAPGHQPQETLATAIAGLRDGLRAIGFADPAFRESQLMRLKVLERWLESGAMDADLRWSPHAH